MIRFLNKETELDMLGQLFDLLYENMHAITPSGLPYAEEKQQWLSEVAPAMAKPPRQIVLLLVEETLAGYLQYYINNGLFMVEEIQFRRDCRSSTLFASLWKFMHRILPENTHTIEAYADPRNHLSCALMRKLGMEPVEDGHYPHLLHFRGSLKEIGK